MASQFHKVRLINPWTGATPPDKEMSWLQIKGWGQENVHPRDLEEWLAEAKKAYANHDGDQLGIMIIGS